MIWKTCGLYSAISALALFCRLSFANGVSQNVALAWSPDPTGLTAGYVVYSGTTSGDYTNRIDVGTNTQITLSGFLPQSTNYFVLTAYDSSGNESAPSPEIAYVIPIALTLIPANGPGTYMAVKFPVMTGHWYELQACTNLVGWTTIWQTPVLAFTGFETFPDFDSPKYSQRYYRLVLH